jgi:carbon-monoxide dehydrogenase medium subunit
MSTFRDSLFYASSISEATATLVDLGSAGSVLAGGTWIMRAPLRGEIMARQWISLNRIADLRCIDIGPDDIEIGACATHSDIAAALGDLPDCRVLADAAAASANPAVRNMATLGGNLSTLHFAAADLVPALLSLQARVVLAMPQGDQTIGLEDFLERRKELLPRVILRSVLVRRQPRLSAHVRLTMRRAADYPVAIVSMTAAIKHGGMFAGACVAVGSVEPVARRWRTLEQALLGARVDPEAAARIAVGLAGDFCGRDGLDAPGWYREVVLPALVRRAVARLQRPKLS